jgi:hypothetical protein
MYVVVSLPRIGQVAASSQQKECMPNSTVMWSLGIECTISIWTQTSCLSSGSGWLLLLPYALLALKFEEWQWEHFTGALYSNHPFHWFPFYKSHFFWCCSNDSPEALHVNILLCKYPCDHKTVGEAETGTKWLKIIQICPWP